MKLRKTTSRSTARKTRLSHVDPNKTHSRDHELFPTKRMKKMRRQIRSKRLHRGHRVSNDTISYLKINSRPTSSCARQQCHIKWQLFQSITSMSCLSTSRGLKYISSRTVKSRTLVLSRKSSVHFLEFDWTWKHHQANHAMHSSQSFSFPAPGRERVRLSFGCLFFGDI